MLKLQYQSQKTMRGGVIVEFALFIPLLLVLTFGATEFGRAIYQYNTLVKAVRDSVRHLSQFNPADTNTYSKEISNAKCLAVYGYTCDILTGKTIQPLAPGLTTDLVYICDRINIEDGCKKDMYYANVATDAGSSINLVEVGITGYTFSFLLDPRSLLPGSSSQGSIIFDDIAATMRQL